MTQQLAIGDLSTSDAIAALHARHAKRSSKTKAEDIFDFDLRRFRVPSYVRQWQLEKSDQSERKRAKPLAWQFDFYFPEYRLIVEIDGGIWTQGAHGHPVDIQRNMRKRNDATLAGHALLAFTTQEVEKRTKPAIEFTMRVLHAKGWQCTT
jgi:very-short-patch-repair endonuclease